jgi:hypothetical protein
VDKNGAASACDTGPGVVIKLYDEVVEPVLPPQTISLLAWMALDRMIIPVMSGIFDPRVVRSNGPGRQQGQRMREAVGAPP